MLKYLLMLVYLFCVLFFLFVVIYVGIVMRCSDCIWVAHALQIDVFRYIHCDIWWYLMIY